MAIINYDSRGARILGRIWELFLLNLLWILGSLPILTIGTSSIAAHATSLKIVEDEDIPVVTTFFTAFRANLGQGILLTIVLAVFSAGVLLYSLLFDSIEGNPIIFSILAILSAVLLLTHTLYIFPLVARYKNNLFGHFTNARQIFIRFFPQTILCLLIVAFEIWLFMFNGATLMLIGLFLVPILVIVTVSSFASNLFGKLEKENSPEQKTDNLRSNVRD